MKLIDDGRVEEGSFLIVESLDRLSREAVIDAASQLLKIVNMGITVVTLSDGQEYSRERMTDDWSQIIISLVVMARAHDESRIKSDRVGAAWRQKKKRAREEGKPITPRCPEWLEVRDGTFVLRQDRIEIVQRIFKETIEGFGRREIVRRLNLDGIPTFRGGIGWQTSSIAKIVQSRAVLGEYQPHTGTHKNRNRVPDGEPIKDYYPKIVDEDTFWLAKSATIGRRQAAAGRKGTQGAHILQGIATCGVCAGRMHILNKGRPPKGGIYLACSNNKRSAGCNNDRVWRLDQFERDLLHAINEIDPSSLARLDERPSRAEAKLSILRAELAELELSMEALIPLVEKRQTAVMKRSLEIADQINAILEVIEITEADLRRAVAEQNLAPRLIDAVALSRTLETLSDEDAEAKREIRIRLRDFLPKVLSHVVCEPTYGASIIFRSKQRITFRMPGFGVKRTFAFPYRLNDGHLEILLEREAPKETVRAWASLTIRNTMTRAELRDFLERRRELEREGPSE